jgi:hypothetical protein
MAEDTCDLANTNDGQVKHGGNSYSLASKDAVLKLAAAPEPRTISVAASSSFGPMVLVSKDCSMNQTNDTKVSFLLRSARTSIFE